MAKRKSESEQRPAPSEAPSTSERASPSGNGTASGTASLPIIAGIGASAGGIEALQAFFEAVPADLDVAFVVVVHLSPEHRSELASILEGRTTMPVRQVAETVPLEGGCVYVIPPGRRLEISDHAIGALPFEEPRGQRMPIDSFFRSLAAQHGDGFGVILSGGGSDGSAGLKAVKEAGGLVLVQDPKEAAYDSMPRSAIATGVADLVLPVRELAAQLAALTHTKRRVREALRPEAPDALSGDDEATLGRILAHLRVRTGHDFSRYKRSTVLRRIARRMQVNRTEKLTDYHAFLRDHAEEAQALFDDLLISVTTFFRDPEAWQALAEKVVPKLLDEKPDGPIRVWVPGCATGEEAYSVAMLLLEEAARRDAWPKIQVFATDLDEGALAVGREGRYPAAIATDVSEERLRRFFRPEGDHFCVTKELRDMVLFATHSLLRDPPFSRLDLLSCRNLLIYLDRAVQEQVFGICRYALRSGGYLFLGAAENAEAKYFRPLDKKQRLFRAREATGQEPPYALALLLAPPPDRPTASPPHRATAPLPAHTTHRRLLETLAPPSLLVDENLNTVHLSETAGRYLLPPGGPLTRDVTALVRPELQAELRAALHRAFSKDEGSLTPFVPVRFDGTTRRVALLVRPRPAEGGDAAEWLALVVFIEGGEMVPAEEARAGDRTRPETVQMLQEELTQTRIRLESLREESEAYGEELRAANEELQSTNEEYRSAAEELETSKEELQSINEELETVNGELKAKLDEVRRAHSDLENLMGATEIGTLFLDRALCIQRFTPRVADLFNVTLADRGRPVSDFTHHLDYDHLAADARQVLDTLAPVEREARSTDGRAYLVRLRPYRTVDDKIDGVVMTFVDVTDRKAAEDAVEAARDYAEGIVDTVREPLLVLTPELRVQSANPAFYRTFQIHPEETEGRLVYELGNGQWDIPALRTLLEEVLPTDEAFHDFEVTRDFEGLGRRTMLLNARRLEDAPLVLLAIEDVTERAEAAQALRQSEERYRLLVEGVRDYAIFQLDASGRVIEWPEGAERVKGYTPEEVLGRHLSMFFPPEAVAAGEPDRELAEAAATGRAERESWRIRKGGERFWVNEIATALYDAEGALVGFTKISRDLTERRAAEEMLHQREAQFRRAITAAAVPVMMHADDGEILAVSDAVVELTGYARDELLRVEDWTRLAYGDRAAECTALIESGFRDGLPVENLELPVQTRAGDVRTWVFSAGPPERLPDGRRYYVCFANDITERARIEGALRDLNETLEARVAEATEQVRALASTLTLAEQEERRRISQILHDDLQQLLYGVQLQMAAVVEGVESGGQTAAAEDAALAQTWLRDAIQTARRLTVDLSPPVLKGEGLADALGWLATQMKQTHGLHVVLDAEKPFRLPNEALRMLLFQIVRELLFNAVKHAGTDRATVALRQTDEHIVITVRDEGRGFDVAQVGSTREGGFGLFSVRERLALFGGRLEVVSAPGEGTTVAIYAPIALTGE